MSQRLIHICPALAVAAALATSLVLMPSAVFAQEEVPARTIAEDKSTSGSDKSEGKGEGEGEGEGDKETESDDESSTKSEDEEDDESYRLIPPIVWGDNKEFKLQMGGDTRIRAEYRDNYDLDDSSDHSNDGLGFIRTRINFDLTYSSCVRAFVEILDGREIDALYEQRQDSHFDLHQAFVDLKQPDDGPWTLRLGRQELDLGRDKLLSEGSNWNNLRRHFDGVKGMYRTEDLDVDLFVLQPGYYERRRGDDTITDRARRRTEEYFYGIYATSRHPKPHTVEYYFLGKSDREERRTFAPNRTSEDGTYGSEHRYTVGSAIYGPLHEDDEGELTYSAQGAWQFGRTSKDQIRAYFFHGDLTYEWKRKWKPSLGIVGTLASGDRDPNDGVAGRFDPLFGASHSPYGIMDVVRAENLRELGVIGKIEPTDKLTLQAEAHAYWLDSKTDEWAAGPDMDDLRDERGRSGRNLGQEISLEAEYEYNDNLTFEAGAAHFFPGGFPSAQGRSDGANLFYIQTEFRF